MLLVDDVDDNREFLVLTLASSGFEVAAFRNSSEALGEAMGFLPNILILDIHLADEKGDSLLAKFRAIPELSGVPAVALTADARPGSRERYLAQGFNAYYAKPILDMDSFLQSLRTLASAR